MFAPQLVVHWRWIACMVRGQQSEASCTRVALGGVGLARLLTLAATPLLAPLERAGELRQLSRLSPSAIPAPQNPQPRETIEALGNVEPHATSEAARMMEVLATIDVVGTGQVGTGDMDPATWANPNRRLAPMASGESLQAFSRVVSWVGCW